jgi:hypothetical protein
MHRMFTDQERRNGNGAEVTYDFYRTVFRSWDLSFGRPQSDICATCTRFGVDIDSAGEHAQERQELVLARRAHLLEAKRAYAMRARDRALAVASVEPVIGPGLFLAEDAVEMMESDMQAVLHAPTLRVADAYYKRKMAVRKYAIYSAQADAYYMHVWSEQQAPRGSNEIISVAHAQLCSRATGATQLIWQVECMSCVRVSTSGVVCCGV